MRDAEQIPVYIRVKNGRTVCICHVRDKGCDRDCERDLVTRFPMRGWRSTMKRDRYGK